MHSEKVDNPKLNLEILPLAELGLLSRGNLTFLLTDQSVLNEFNEKLELLEHTEKVPSDDSKTEIIKNSKNKKPQDTKNPKKHSSILSFFAPKN